MDKQKIIEKAKKILISLMGDGDCLNCVDYEDWKEEQVESIYYELKKDLDDDEFEVNLDEDE